MSDTEVEDLRQRIEELESEQERLRKQYEVTKDQNERVLNLFQQFKHGKISRRSFLASVTAIAGIGYLAGSARAQVSPNWSNASGSSGTESKPLKNVFAKNAYIQSFDIESLSTEKIDSSDGYEWTDESGNRSLDSWYQAPSDRDIYFMFNVESQSDGTEIQLLVDINTTQTTNLLTSASGTFNQGLEFSIGPYRVPAGHYYKIRPARDTANYSLTNWSELR